MNSVKTRNLNLAQGRVCGSSEIDADKTRRRHKAVQESSPSVGVSEAPRGPSTTVSKTLKCMGISALALSGALPGAHGAALQAPRAVIPTPEREARPFMAGLNGTLEGA